MKIVVDYKDLDGSENPVTNHCRKLISEGVVSETSLEAWKNGKLNMTVKEIGKAATVIAEEGRFRKYRQSVGEPRGCV